MFQRVALVAYESFTGRQQYAVKYLYIYTDIFWRVFPMWARASLFRRFTDTNACGTGSVKIWKTRHKMSTDIRMFFYSAPDDSSSSVPFAQAS